MPRLGSLKYLKLSSHPSLPKCCRTSAAATPGAVPASDAAARLEDDDPVDAHLHEVADHAVDLVALRQPLMDLDVGAGGRGNGTRENLGPDGSRRHRREPGIGDRAPAVGDAD